VNACKVLAHRIGWNAQCIMTVTVFLFSRRHPFIAVYMFISINLHVKSVQLSGADGTPAGI
jgi:hypothetical protein